MTKSLILLRHVGRWRCVIKWVVLITGQLIPQILINYKRRGAASVEPIMVIMWISAGIPLGIYNIVRDFNILLQLQPQILTLLSLAIYGQYIHYEKVRCAPKLTISSDRDRRAFPLSKVAVSSS
jgi:PQ loop repeat